MSNRFDSSGKTHTGPQSEGQQLAAGAWYSHPMDFNATAGIIPCGMAPIIVSLPDVAGRFNSANTGTEVVRKLLGNFLAFAETANKLEEPLL